MSGPSAGDPAMYGTPSYRAPDPHPIASTAKNHLYHTPPTTETNPRRRLVHVRVTQQCMEHTQHRHAQMPTGLSDGPT